MKWSKTPELTLKKNETAKFSGVLVPELNYQNYKTFENTFPEMEKRASVQKVECETNNIFNIVLWTAIGFVAGALVVQIK